MLPAALVAAVGVAGVLVIVFEVRPAYRRVESTMKDRAAVVGTVVASQVEARYRNRQVDAIRRAVTALVVDPRLLRGSLVGPRDSIWFATDPAAEGETMPSEAWVEMGFPDGRPSRSWVGQTVLVRNGQQVVGVFPVRIPSTPDDVRPERMAALVLRYDLTVPKAVAFRAGLRHGLVIAAFGALMALSLWWYLARLISGRMARLVMHTRRLGMGEEEPAVPVLSGGDELAELSTAVADMAGRIREGNRDLARRETILTAVSFVARRVLAADTPEHVMDDVLEPLGRATGVDRVCLVRDEVDEEGRAVACYRWEWNAGGPESPVDAPEPRSIPWDPAFTRWRERFLDGRHVAGPVSGLPQPEREVLEAQGIKALAAVPISVRDRLYGFLGFDDAEDERLWSEGELGALQTAAGVIGAALERAAAHRRVQRSESRLRNAQRIARLGHWEWSLESDRVEWSEQTYEIFGLDADSFVPTNDEVFRYIHDDDRSRVEALVESAVSTGSAYEVEFRIVRPDGEIRTVHVHGRIQPDAEGVASVLSGIVQDITTLREAERQRGELEAQLRQAQKLEAVGQLTGGIAHDFNNLLAVILTNAQLIEAELPADAAGLRTELRDLRQAARSGADLVQGLLGFSRRAALQLQATDLGAGVERTLELLRRVISADIDIQIHHADEPVQVLADPKAVQQVLINLVTNARDAMSDGGVLRISVDVRTLADQDLPGVGPGTYGTVTVEDTGPGIPAGIRERIFEPFFTTKSHGTGSGLGLATAHGLVAQHGGFVDVESVEGEGTRFTVGFPRVAADASTPDDEVDDAPQRGDETILFVEDQDAVRRTAERVLNRLGYTVLSAANGQEALALLERHEGEVDLIVSDLVMPTMGGIDLAEQVRERYTGLPFLFVSGYASGELEGRGPPADFTYLRKPWTIRELAARLREALDGPA